MRLMIALTLLKNSLQGATGDALHALCCAVGDNLRWLMRAVVRLGLGGFLHQTPLKGAVTASLYDRGNFGFR